MTIDDFFMSLRRISANEHWWAPPVQALEPIRLFHREITFSHLNRTAAFDPLAAVVYETTSEIIKPSFLCPELQNLGLSEQIVVELVHAYDPSNYGRHFDQKLRNNMLVALKLATESRPAALQQPVVMLDKGFDVTQLCPLAKQQQCNVYLRYCLIPGSDVIPGKKEGEPRLQVTVYEDQYGNDQMDDYVEFFVDDLARLKVEHDSKGEFDKWRHRFGMNGDGFIDMLVRHTPHHLHSHIPFDLFKKVFIASKSK